MTNIFPNGLAADPVHKCARYDSLIGSLGGIDVQLLEIGHNGHIGFNEPNEAFEKTTHVVELKQSTIDANARFFEDKSQVHTHAITMVIKSIMNARKILLIVNGKDKKGILEKALFGPVTPRGARLNPSASPRPHRYLQR